MESILLNWFKRWHGLGAGNQVIIYRCEQCHKLVTHRIIEQGGCSCSGSRVRPTNPSFGEKAKLLIAPWMVR